MVNKVMWTIDMSNLSLETFQTDPARFLDDWEAAAGNPDPPFPWGGTLTAEERRALETLDFGALYAMGCNPYLLWQFARSVTVPDRYAVEDLIVRFHDAVAPHGYPDFAS